MATEVNFWMGAEVFKRNLLLRRVLVTATAAGVAILGGPVAAQAADGGAASRTTGVSAAAGSRAFAGWIGSCYVWRAAHSAGGWCDGNGPDWTYRAFVNCTGGSRSGVSHWAGDRRGSVAECPSGTSNSGGVRYYYQGSYRGSATV